MLKQVKKILASGTTDSQKINEIRELANSSLEPQEVVDLLKNALGKPQPGLPWDNMPPAELRALLSANPVVAASEYAKIKEDDADGLRLVLNHWARSIKVDPGGHISTKSSEGKAVYNLESNGASPKPETILKVLRDLGLSDGYSISFTIQDKFTKGQAVTIDGNIARLCDRANPFQWWAEVVVDGQKQIRLVELRDIQSV